jgi:hypothetical protein
MNVLPEVGSVLNMIPATSGTRVRIVRPDMRFERYEFPVISYAVVVVRAWKDDAGAAHYSTTIEPVVISDGNNVTTVGAYRDAKKAQEGITAIMEELWIEPS